MQYRFLLSVFCYLISFFSISQNNPDNIEDLQETYSSYFALEREVPYLHLNKTSFLAIENLWFAAYAFNLQHPKNTDLTTNLTVAIYDSEGKHRISKVLYIENGYGSGNFNFIHSLEPGEYLIRAFSNYSKNFQNPNEFTQKFTIVSTSNKEKVSQASSASSPTKNSLASETSFSNQNYDLQLLPEGGHLLEDAVNNIAVKLINGQGKSVPFKKGKLINNQKAISTFKSSPYGTSSFSIQPKKHIDYFVEVELENGKVISKKLPPIDTRGLTLTCNVFSPNEIIVAVKTNPASINQVKDKKYSLIIHQAGKMKGVGFQISEKDLQSNIRLKKSKLYPGVNTITIFNEDFEPILERLVFNRTTIPRQKITLAQAKNLGDSLSIQLQLANKPEKPTLNKISVSVLPKSSQVYKPDNNSLSAYFLKPYLKGYLENADAYFSQDIRLRKRDYYLDLLLKTQGWSKYKWHSIFNATPKILFKKQQGFTIDGKIKDINFKKEKTAMIKSKSSNLFQIVPLEEDGSFALDSAYVLNQNDISIGVINARNSKISRSKLYSIIRPAVDTSDFEEAKQYAFKSPKKLEENKSRDFSKFIQVDQILDSVVITGYKKRTSNKQHTAFSEITTIDESLSKSFLYITDYIAQQGFNVHRHAGAVEIFSRRRQSFGGPAVPVVVIDDIPFFDNRGSDFLMNLYTDEVETIEIRKTGSSQFASNGTGGVIRIKTRIDSSFNVRKPTTQNFLTNSGFTEPDEYYAPKYKYYSPSFKKFGVVDWQSMLVVDKKGKVNFKIPNTGVPEITLHIEGFSQNGHFISEKLHLSQKDY